MGITGITFKFMIIGQFMSSEWEAEIPLTGGEKILTHTSRGISCTDVKKYRLTDDTVTRFNDIIAKYNIADWIGKTPAQPQASTTGSTYIVPLMTLHLDDGTDAKITFREADAGTGNEAAEDLRKLIVWATADENKISEEKIYPDLDACRKMKEEHGPVIAVETYHSSNGMMMNSNETVTQLIEKVPGKEGTVKVTVTKKAGQEPEATGSNELESDIFTKIQEISDRENIPGWQYVCRDPSIPVDRSMIPTDFSSSSSLYLYYDDSLITGVSRVKRTIGESARQMGGEETDNKICELINECIKASGVDVKMPEINLFKQSNGMPIMCNPNNAFIGMGMMGMGQQAGTGAAPQPAPQTSSNTGAAEPSEWQCSCGRMNTGKFCCECGTPRPAES